MSRRTPSSARHPIGVVAERTGLTPEVLRAWERRYDLVQPTRGEGGHRLYSDADIARLTLVARVAARGRGVGQVAALSDAELTRLAAEDGAQGRPPQHSTDTARDDAFHAVKEFAPDHLRQILRRSLLSTGAMVFLDEVLVPLLREIGNAWHDDRLGVAQEHSASAVITQLLGGLIDELVPPGPGPSLVLATPAGERHTIGALIAGVAAAHDGWRVTWVGGDLPAAQIAAAASRHRAHVVGLTVLGLEGRGVAAREVAQLRKTLPAATALVVGGSGAPGIGEIAGVTVVGDLSHWRSVLRTHGPARRARAS